MPEFWVNQHVMDVTEQIIGSKPDLSFARSNVCLPYATGRQAVHADGPSDVLRFTYMVYVSQHRRPPNSQANKSGQNRKRVSMRCYTVWHSMLQSTGESRLTIL
jgi:hypothetical protein